MLQVTEPRLPLLELLLVSARAPGHVRVYLVQMCCRPTRRRPMFHRLEQHRRINHRIYYRRKIWSGLIGLALPLVNLRLLVDLWPLINLQLLASPGPLVSPPPLLTAVRQASTMRTRMMHGMILLGNYPRIAHTNPDIMCKRRQAVARQITLTLNK